MRTRDRWLNECAARRGGRVLRGPGGRPARALRGPWIGLWVIATAACTHGAPRTAPTTPDLQGIWTDAAQTHTLTLYGDDYTFEVSACSAHPCGACVGQIELGAWRQRGRTLALTGDPPRDYDVAFADGGAELVLTSTAHRDTVRLRRRPPPPLAGSRWYGDDWSLDFDDDHYRLAPRCDASEAGGTCAGRPAPQSGTWQVRQELTEILVLRHGATSQPYEINAYDRLHLRLVPLGGDEPAGAFDLTRAQP